MSAVLTESPTSTPTHGQGYRPDIQGLRAVAVGLVLLFHAGVPGMGGGFVGVDIFFVISGYLITGLILREVRSTGRLRVGAFYLRRARRLLPATAVVFAVVAGLTLALMPVTRWRDISGDLFASTTYLMNWRLAAGTVDYLSAGAPSSPLQHFWSLAVEEQFYVVWPILILVLIAWSARIRRRWTPLRVLAIGLLTVAVPSFAWSVHLTQTAPGPAYFVSTTRLWELSLGGLVAIAAPMTSMIARSTRRALGWIGLAAVTFAATQFSGDTVFPSWTALVPTAGAALLIISGTGGQDGTLRLLTIAPMRSVGSVSYSLYLWHWPLLVVATAIWGDPAASLGVLGSLAVVAVSVVPAWLTYRLVEQPIHHSRSLSARPGASLAVAAACVAVGLSAAFVVQQSVPDTRSGAVALDRNHPGATALGTSPEKSPAGRPLDHVADMRPTLALAADDLPDVYDDGCRQVPERSAVLSCTYGDPDAATRVALVGDSHAAQWLPALQALASSHDWRIDTYTKSGCLFADVDVWLALYDKPYTSCSTWVGAAMAKLLAQPPDVVVTSDAGIYSTVASGAEVSRPRANDALAAGMGRTWKALDDAGIPVVVIADTPNVGLEVPDCLARHPAAMSTCAVERDAALAESARSLQRAAGELAPGAAIVDLTRYICPQSQCAPVIGKVIVWRDAHHLTATYARTLAGPLGDALDSTLFAAPPG